jgi:hypothetical protein
MVSFTDRQTCSCVEGEMIRGSNIELRIGSVVHPKRGWDAFGSPLETQPLYVVRQASRAEWEEQIISQGATVGRSSGPYFYEFSTD